MKKGEPVPLNQVLLMFYHIGLKLKKPPDERSEAIGEK